MGKEGEEREKEQSWAVAVGTSGGAGGSVTAACFWFGTLCRQPGCSFWLVTAAKWLFTEVFLPAVDSSYKPKLAAAVQAEFSSIRGHFSSVMLNFLGGGRKLLPPSPQCAAASVSILGADKGPSCQRGRPASAEQAPLRGLPLAG